jgi:hypothetical protein
MNLKVNGLSENFLTLLTSIRFFSTVNSFMNMKVTGMSEGFHPLLHP